MRATNNNANKSIYLCLARMSEENVNYIVETIKIAIIG